MKYTEKNFPMDERSCILVLVNEISELSRVIRYWMQYNNKPADTKLIPVHEVALEDQVPLPPNTHVCPQCQHEEPCHKQDYPTHKCSKCGFEFV